MSRLSAQLLALTGSAKRGIVAFDTTMPATGRQLPTWDIQPRQPISEILNRTTQASEDE